MAVTRLLPKTGQIRTKAKYNEKIVHSPNMISTARVIILGLSPSRSFDNNNNTYSEITDVTVKFAYNNTFINLMIL